jgi:hypothetical protein
MCEGSLYIIYGIYIRIRPCLYKGMNDIEDDGVSSLYIRIRPCLYKGMNDIEDDGVISLGGDAINSSVILSRTPGSKTNLKSPKSRDQSNRFV